MRNFTFPIRLSAYFFALIFFTSVSHASSLPDDSLYFYQPNFERERDPSVGTKMLADLNVGESRIVRVVYFLPNDRMPHPEMDMKLDELIKGVQQFYANEMERYGFGRKTFTLETDSGKTRIHHIDGQFTALHYDRLEERFNGIWEEVREQFNADTSEYIYLIIAAFLDPKPGDGGGAGRYDGGPAMVWVPSFDPANKYEFPDSSIEVMAHELGHVFGLFHDERKSTYIMTVGRAGEWEDQRLSKSAAGWLSTHPYFNPGPTFDRDLTKIRMLPSVVYPPNAIRLRFNATDQDGLSYVHLLLRPVNGYEILHSSIPLNGQENGTIEFITSDLAKPIYARSRSGQRRRIGTASNTVALRTIDMKGNIAGFSSDPILVDHIERVDGVIKRNNPEVETIRKVSGDNQYGYINSRLTNPFIVRVLDKDEEPIAGVLVSFRIIADNGKLSDTKLWTDYKGEAQSFLTLGDSQVEYRVAVSIEELPAPVTFSVTIDPSTVGATPLKTLTGHTDEIRSVTYSPDGKTIASSDDTTIRIWDAATGKIKTILSVPGHLGGVASVAYSPDGKTLASGSIWPETTILWDIERETRKQTIEGQPLSGIASVAYSPDNNILATGTSGGEIHLRDATTGRHKVTLAHPLKNDRVPNVTGLAFSPDSRILVSRSIIRLALWDVVEEKLLEAFDVRSGKFVAFSEDGNMLATYTTRGEILLWDATTFQPLDPLRVLTGYPRRSNTPFAFSPDRKILAIGGYGSEILLWDIEKRKSLNVFLIGHKGIVNSLAFSPDGYSLASGDPDGTIQIWDISPYTTSQTLASDFDGDGTVGIPDFLLFVDQFGFSENDEGYEAQFDLDGDGVIGIGDFLIFVDSFGKKVS